MQRMLITRLYIVSGILTPADEFQYWSEQSSRGSSSESRERAEHFLELLQPVRKELGSLESLSLLEIQDIVEECQDCLDDVWKQVDHRPPYPEQRMKHFMDVIGED